MTFNIITLGCKVNAYESEIMKELLLNAGYKEEKEHPEVVIINTCSVTNMADSKSRKMVRRYKRENPNTILVVCGCSTQNKKEEYEQMDIDILLGNKDKSKIVTLINNFKNNHEKYIKFYDDRDLDFEDMTVKEFTSHARAFVKIQDGCNNFCSYCVIPYVRGNIRSKDFNKSLEEIKTLVKNNHKEIVLTGIHTGSYGAGLNYDLSDLLHEMNKIEGLERIRISSIEVTELNEKFLNELKENKKICNHMHIPLQAGSDEILKAMNRKYDLSYFFEKIKKIREIRPNISITTDVIVGFPGETTELFEQTIKTCRDLEFTKIHVFPYSERQGTKAMELPNHIESNEKKRRARELLLVSKELEITYANKFLNKQVEVLIEEDKDGYSYGHTSNYLHVKINKKLKHNTFVTVTITKVDYPYCLAK